MPGSLFPKSGTSPFGPSTDRVRPGARQRRAGRLDRLSAAVLTGDAVLAMPEIGVELPLVEVYAGITFATDDPSPEDA